MSEPTSPTNGQLFEPRTAVVTIYTGDYLDRIQHLAARANAAWEREQELTPTADETTAYDLAREHDALVEEAEREAIHVRVKSLPRKAWKQLVSEHPPRTEDSHPGLDHRVYRVDHLDGVNRETFPDALVTTDGRTKQGGPLGEGIPFRTIVGPDWLTDEHLEQFADRDFERVYLTALGLNRGDVEAPKASLVSQMIQRNDETSSKQNGST